MRLVRPMPVEAPREVRRRADLAETLRTPEPVPTARLAVGAIGRPAPDASRPSADGQGARAQVPGRPLQRASTGHAAPGQARR